MNKSDFENLPSLPEFFGSIQQVSYVVTDIDQAMRHWQENYRVGPFLIARNQVPLKNAYYRGAKSQEVAVNIAFAYIDGMQLELTELIGNTPSLYQEALDANHKGVHHYAVCVEDFAPVYNLAKENGFKPVVDSGIDGLARMSYMENDAKNLILEVIEWNELTKPYFDEIAARCMAIECAATNQEFNLSELGSAWAVVRKLGFFLVNKLTGRVVRTMPS